MRERTLKLLLIEPDPVFRKGLRVVVEQFPDLQVVAEAETGNAALQILAAIFTAPTAATSNIPPTCSLDLVVLEPSFNRSQPGQMLGLQLCQQLKSQYPNLPVLLFSSLQEPTQLAAAKAIGVDGYCPKGVAIFELVGAMRQVAAGRSYWVESGFTSQNEQLIHSSGATSPLATLRNRLRLSGLRQIDATLAQVTAQLQVPGLPLLDQAFLAGQRRELLAARWLVNQLLAAPEGRIQDSLEPQPQAGVRSHASELPPTSNTSPPRAIPETETSSELSFKSLQSALFESTLAELQFSLENLTSVPLEIDILRTEKKRELLYLILRKLEVVLNELRFSQVQPSQLPEIQSAILRDLWQAATTDLFGKYSTLRVGNRELEIVNILLQDAPVVQTAILDKIPLVYELFSHLLFQTPLAIDNVSYPASSPEAMSRAESLLQNLLIQLANGVVQPLLNKFADVEAIKENFYDRRLISTREIERFRNNLSWKYRLENYIEQPKAIFESRYELFVLASRGIAKISIYAPRGQELAQLSGIQFAVTLALETRDAIAPRIRAAVTFLGRGVVYVLTQVIGRAIGLIGRGILQGIGSSSKFRN